MESSRRSAVDRSNGAGLKRPRSIDPNNSMATKAAAIGGSSYQEILEEYKMAIGELTFNSKPVITNLTIIAGENVHAAKGIAAIICENVVEVPSEQKLPSLYLLDSIVKNIGGDYIKYFASRLPEVFCKAYKQVDPSLHSSMRHLFGTWKGVFPIAPLRMIEKELGFQPLVNKSGSASSKIDLQTQRPAHSIHVNPKYLEARDQFQQSTRINEIGKEDSSDGIGSFMDLEKAPKNTDIGSANWPDQSNKVLRPQRDIINGSVKERRESSDARDYAYSLHISRESDLGVGSLHDKPKVRGQVRPYYGAGPSASEEQVSRRNAFDGDNSYGFFRNSESLRGSTLDSNFTDRSSVVSTGSWKNSEEDEYVWDDMNSTSSDYGNFEGLSKAGWKNNALDRSIVSQKDKWAASETGYLEPDKVDTFTAHINKNKVEDRILPYKRIEEHDMQPRLRHESDPRMRAETFPELSFPRRPASEDKSILRIVNEAPTTETEMHDRRLRVGQLEGQPISFRTGLSTSTTSSLSVSGRHSQTSSSSINPCSNISAGGSYGLQRQSTLQPLSDYGHSSPSYVSNPNHKPHGLIDYSQRRCSSTPFDQRSIHLSAKLDPSQQVTEAQEYTPTLIKTDARPLKIVLEGLSMDPSPHLENFADPVSSKLSGHFKSQFAFMKQSQTAASQPHTGIQSQTLYQSEKVGNMAMGYGSNQIGRDTNTRDSNDPVKGSEPNARNLVRAYGKSGTLQNNSAGNFEKSNTRPPLPCGPPPFQMTSTISSDTTSLLPSSADGAKIDAELPLKRNVLPPFSLGPPSSTAVKTNSEDSGTAAANLNPLSSLLSSLVAKGLISSQAKDVKSESLSQTPPKFATNNTSCSSNSLSQISFRSGVPHTDSLTENEACGSASVAPVPAGFSKNVIVEPRELIGAEFKLEVIRTLHPLVVRSLLDDLTHQCKVCGLRFRFERQLLFHLDSHASDSDKCEASDFIRKFRKWYPSMNSLVPAEVDPQSRVIQGDDSIDEIEPYEKETAPMVLSDESQSICILCGEPFEDVYSEEKDGWMYKGTLYLNLQTMQGVTLTGDENTGQLPIVHAQCLSASAFGAMNVIKHEDNI